MSAGTRYDRLYFDKWYRDPTHRVRSHAELRRQVDFVLSTAEFVLNRPVRSVLDVGCGEGNWRSHLLRHRPSLRYTGVDPSPYAVGRFGASRNLLLGDIESLGELPLKPAYDLVVCCGMLNYLPVARLLRGLDQVAALVGGVAYLEIFSSEDSCEGDTNWPTPKPANWYSRAIREAGLDPIGMQCYVPTRFIHRLSALEHMKS